MAYPFTHAFAGAAIGLALAPREKRLKFAAATGVAAILPDLDVIAYHAGVPYSSMFFHRGITHSFAFALAISLLVVLVGFRSLPDFRSRKYLLIPAFFAAVVSHPIIDGLTDGGAGIMYFAPFSHAKYFLPWRPIHVASVGAIIRLRPAGKLALLSEFKHVWLPVTVLAGCVLLARHRLTSRSRNASTE